MKYLKNTGIFLIMFLILQSCNPNETEEPEPEPIDTTSPPPTVVRIDKGTIESDEITEGSGIEASTKNPDVFWTFNDHGGENKIYAFSSTGKDLGTYTLAGAKDQDWEDIAIGPGPAEGEYYIYIGDFGDNGHKRDVKTIYRVLEPDVRTSQHALDTTLNNVTRHDFWYPSTAKYNAEALMVDPLTNDIFIVTKDNNTKAFKIKDPDDFHKLSEIKPKEVIDAGTLYFQSKANAADISDNGSEILIKDDDYVYYWKRDTSKTVEAILSQSPKLLTYIKEPNGEGICWAPDTSGYYTFSEGKHAHIYFYPRQIIDDQK